MRLPTRRIAWSLGAGLLASSACAAGAPERRAHEFEASGVVRAGGDLLFVDDHTPGAYFRIAAPRAQGALEVTHENAERVELDGLALARDLESIELRGKEVFVLSEELHTLLGSEGTTYEYSKELASIGNRGLEGIAFAADGKHAAALWEGGDLSADDLQEELRAPLAGVAPLPLVVVHDLPREGKHEKQGHDDSARVFALQTPAAPGATGAMHFRGSDLVWSPAEGDELVVLLDSTAPSGSHSNAHLTWLQRFGPDGEPRGVPLDVGAWLRAHDLAAIAEANWEGLAWWEPGRTLVLVNDAGRDGPTHAVFLPLPAGWLDAPVDGAGR